MAKFFNVHGAFSGGISGEHFDVCQGHNVTYTTPATDCTFAATGNTLTLVSGTWPTWIRVPGKEFVVTGTTNNNSTFHTQSIDITNKILTVVETPVNEAAQTVTTDGTIDTKLITTLLKSGNGQLTADAPLTLSSTGSLGASRTLDIALLELEDSNQNGEVINGRPILFSVRNSDISNTRKITIFSSTPGTVNGAATFEIKKQGDYLLWHEEAGTWRANYLNNPGESHATIAEIPFTAADWNNGSTKNQIKVLQTGTPTAGEVGPHALKIASTYSVSVANTDLTRPEIVDVEVQFDVTPNGDVYMIKAQKTKPFSGIVTILGAL